MREQRTFGSRVSQSSVFDLPEETIIDLRKGLLIAGAILATAVIAGTAIVTSMVAGGALLFTGFVVIAETNKWVKWFVERGHKAIDIVVFGVSVILIVKNGVVIAGAVGVAGLLYTTQYAPYVRRQYFKRKQRTL